MEPAVTFENIPSVREAAIAMRAIRLNYDPFQYFKATKEEVAADLNQTMETQRQALVQTSERLKLYQALIDEWEKDIVRERHDLTRLTISNFLVYLTERRRRFWFRLGYYFLSLAVFLGALAAIIGEVKRGTFTIESAYLIVLAAIPVVIELIKWHRRSKSKQMA